MDLLTLARLRQDVELRMRVEAACLVLDLRFDEEAVRKVVLDPTVQAACTSTPASAANVPDDAIITALTPEPETEDQ